MGTHQELMENCEIYQEIAKSQLKGDVNNVKEKQQEERTI